MSDHSYIPGNEQGPVYVLAIMSQETTPPSQPDSASNTFLDGAQRLQIATPSTLGVFVESEHTHDHNSKSAIKAVTQYEPDTTSTLIRMRGLHPDVPPNAPGSFFPASKIGKRGAWVLLNLFVLCRVLLPCVMLAVGIMGVTFMQLNPKLWQPLTQTLWVLDTTRRCLSLSVTVGAIAGTVFVEHPWVYLGLGLSGAIADAGTKWAMVTTAPPWVAQLFSAAWPRVSLHNFGAVFVAVCVVRVLLTTALQLADVLATPTYRKAQ